MGIFSVLGPYFALLATLTVGLSFAGIIVAAYFKIRSSKTGALGDDVLANTTLQRSLLSVVLVLASITVYQTFYFLLDTPAGEVSYTTEFNVEYFKGQLGCALLNTTKQEDKNEKCESYEDFVTIIKCSGLNKSEQCETKEEDDDNNKEQTDDSGISQTLIDILYTLRHPVQYSKEVVTESIKETLLGVAQGVMSTVQTFLQYSSEVDLAEDQTQAQETGKYRNIGKLINGNYVSGFLFNTNIDQTNSAQANFFALAARIRNLAAGIMILISIIVIIKSNGLYFLHPMYHDMANEFGILFLNAFVMIGIASSGFWFMVVLKLQETINEYVGGITVYQELGKLTQGVFESLTDIIDNAYNAIQSGSGVINLGFVVSILLITLVVLYLVANTIITNIKREIALLFGFIFLPLFIMFMVDIRTRALATRFFTLTFTALAEQIVRTIMIAIGLSLLNGDLSIANFIIFLIILGSLLFSRSAVMTLMQYLPFASGANANGRV